MAGVIAAVPNADAHLDFSAGLLAAVTTSPHSFLQPTRDLHTAAILATKRLLDPLANDIADAQIKRRKADRKKRKRDDNDGSRYNILQLRQVYTNRLGTKQIWEQGRRILEAAEAEIAAGAEEILRRVEIEGARDKKLERIHERISEDSESTNAEIDTVKEDVLESHDLEGVIEDDIHEDELASEDLEEIIEDDDSETRSDAEDDSSMNRNNNSFVQDPNGLNDGFFSIDEFNRQSQFLEQQDARGDDDNPSDEDEVDWDADPLAMPLQTAPSNNRKGLDNDIDEDQDQDDEDEDGPTFGNADLDELSEEDQSDQTGEIDDPMTGLTNTNDITYADFFEPPPKKPSKTKRMRALPKTQPESRPSHQQGPDDVQGDVERAIADVRRDLFDSDQEPSDTEMSESAPDGALQASNPKFQNLSTHEKQRAKIAAEIRRLESLNVSKKDWTLSGEARAIDRPLNSLVDEDLDFERTGKPVPVITAEVSEEIETLIKRRIIAREFDEVIRRRPEAIGGAADTRRGRVEVDDSKPGQGLADIYELEHLKATDPNYVDTRSATTKKQHAEIDRLWKEVSTQLDLLSNLHFKPKRVEVGIQTVEDKPTISMEDARPVGAETEVSRLAPQEIYRPGDEGKRTSETVGRTGASVHVEEMSREEKLRRRRREKERSKKGKGNRVLLAGAGTGKEGRRSKKAEKEDIIGQLKRGGVKVIGKKGAMEELDGKKKSRGPVGMVVAGASALKL